MKILILVTLFLSVHAHAIQCDQKTKTIVCHAGSEINPNYVNICVDFAALWGHFAHHSMDMYGECPTQSKQPYACNAGIKHLAPTATICYQNDNFLTSTNCDDSENCTCSYAQDEQNKLDYLKLDYSNIDGQEIEGSKLTQASKTAQYATAFDRSEFGKYKIETETLNFNLGSERIGSEYFVDICMESPGADNREKFNLDIALTLADGVLNQSPYVSMTNLKIKTEIYCKKNMKNLNKVFRNLVYETSYNSYTTGGMFLNPSISKNDFCVVRHLFKENQNISYMRKWKHLNVKASSLVDNNEEDVTEDGPFDICHVQQTKVRGKKTYQCEDLRFTSGENYINYILVYNNVRAWRQDHQHDYKGRCESVCGPLNNGN